MSGRQTRSATRRKKLNAIQSQGTISADRVPRVVSPHLPCKQTKLDCEEDRSDTNFVDFEPTEMKKNLEPENKPRRVRFFEESVELKQADAFAID